MSNSELITAPLSASSFISPYNTSNNNFSNNNITTKNNNNHEYSITSSNSSSSISSISISSLPSSSIGVLNIKRGPGRPRKDKQLDSKTGVSKPLLLPKEKKEQSTNPSGKKRRGRPPHTAKIVDSEDSMNQNKKMKITPPALNPHNLINNNNNINTNSVLSSTSKSVSSSSSSCSKIGNENNVIINTNINHNHDRENQLHLKDSSTKLIECNECRISRNSKKYSEYELEENKKNKNDKNHPICNICVLECINCKNDGGKIYYSREEWNIGRKLSKELRKEIPVVCIGDNTESTSLNEFGCFGNAKDYNNFKKSREQLLSMSHEHIVRKANSIDKLSSKKISDAKHSEQSTEKLNKNDKEKNQQKQEQKSEQSSAEQQHTKHQEQQLCISSFNIIIPDGKITIPSETNESSTLNLDSADMISPLTPEEEEEKEKKEEKEDNKNNNINTVTSIINNIAVVPIIPLVSIASNTNAIPITSNTNAIPIDFNTNAIPIASNTTNVLIAPIISGDSDISIIINAAVIPNTHPISNINFNSNNDKEMESKMESVIVLSVIEESIVKTFIPLPSFSQNISSAVLSKPDAETLNLPAPLNMMEDKEENTLEHKEEEINNMMSLILQHNQELKQQEEQQQQQQDQSETVFPDQEILHSIGLNKSNRSTSQESSGLPFHSDQASNKQITELDRSLKHLDPLVSKGEFLINRCLINPGTDENSFYRSLALELTCNPQWHAQDKKIWTHEEVRLAIVNYGKKNISLDWSAFEKQNLHLNHQGQAQSKEEFLDLHSQLGVYPTDGVLVLTALCFNMPLHVFTLENITSEEPCKMQPQGYTYPYIPKTEDHPRPFGWKCPLSLYLQPLNCNKNDPTAPKTLIREQYYLVISSYKLPFFQNFI